MNEILKMDKSTYVKSYGGSAGLIENWLEQTLSHSLKTRGNSSAFESSTVQFKVDRSHLTDLGLNKDAQDRIYRSFFVYVNGMSETIKDFNHIDDGNLSGRLWDVFMRLLEHCDPNHTETFTTYLKQCHVENIKLIESTMKSELEKSKQLNEQMTMDLALAQMQLMDIQYKLDMEMMFNKTLQKRQEFKLEMINTKLQNDSVSNKQITDSYAQCRQENMRNNNLIVHLTTSEKNATDRLESLSKQVFNLEYEVNENRKQNKNLTVQLSRCTEERDRYKTKIQEMQSVRNGLASDKKALIADAKELKLQLKEVSTQLTHSRQCNIQLTDTLDETLHILQQYVEHCEENREKHVLIEDVCNNKIGNYTRRASVLKPPVVAQGKAFAGSKTSADKIITSSRVAHITRDAAVVVPTKQPVNHSAPVNNTVSVPAQSVSDVNATSTSPNSDESAVTALNESIPANVFKFAQSESDSKTAETAHLPVEEQFPDQYNDYGVPVLYKVYIGEGVVLKPTKPHSVGATTTTLKQGQSTVMSVSEESMLQFNPALFKHTQQHVLRYIRTLHLTLTEQTSTCTFNTNFSEVYNHIKYLKSRLNRIESKDKTIVELQRKLVSIQFMCNEYCNKTNVLHSQLTAECLVTSQLRAEITQLNTTIIEKQGQIDSYVVMENKFNTLQDKFVELVEHYRVLALTNTQNESTIVTSNKTIAELRLIEMAHITALDTTKTIQYELSESKRHIDYLLTEKHKTEIIIKQQTAMSGAALHVFIPLLSELQRLEGSIALGVNMYKENQKVAAIDSDSGQKDQVKATNVLQIFLDDIRYTDAEHSGIPDDQKGLIIQTIEVVFTIQKRIQQLYEQCDKVVDLQLEMFKLLSDLDKMKTFCNRERRRIIKHYEDQFKNNANASKGITATNIVSYGVTTTSALQSDD